MCFGPFWWIQVKCKVIFVILFAYIWSPVFKNICNVWLWSTFLKVHLGTKRQASLINIIEDPFQDWKIMSVFHDADPASLTLNLWTHLLKFKLDHGHNLKKRLENWALWSVRCILFKKIIPVLLSIGPFNNLIYHNHTNLISNKSKISYVKKSS